MPSDEEDLLRGLLPAVFSALARKGKLKESHLASQETIRTHLRKEIKYALRHTQVGVELHSDFLKSAHSHWKEGRREIAIVLFATAIEHLINQYYRDALDAQGLPEAEVTTAIRSCSNDAKLSWLLSLSGAERMRPSTEKRIRKIFEIRNAIVHYKFVPSTIDEFNDSHNRISTQIAALGRISLTRNYQIVDRFFRIQIGRLAPWRWTATRAYFLFFEGTDPDKTAGEQDVDPNA